MNCSLTVILKDDDITGTQCHSRFYLSEDLAESSHNSLLRLAPVLKTIFHQLNVSYHLLVASLTLMALF